MREHRKKKLILVLSWLLLLSFLLPVTVSCGNGKTGTETTTEKKNNKPANGFPVVSDGVAARIIYPGGDAQAAEEAKRLADMIVELTSVTPECKMDGFTGGANYQKDLPEILVGNTNYPETQTVTEDLADYSECAVCTVGKKLVIASYDVDSVKTAINKMKSILRDAEKDGNIYLSEKTEERFHAITPFANARVPVFRNTAARIYDGGDDSNELIFTDVTEAEFSEYLTKVTDNGYAVYAENEIEGNLFRTYTSEKSILNLAYMKNNQTMYIIADPRNSTGLPTRAEDNEYTATAETLFTQLGLYSGGKYNGETDPMTSTKDVSGMGYVMRLADSSFLVIDGGHGDPDDAERIYQVMKKQNTRSGEPVIAAWIFTHADSDHVGTFCEFAKEYADKVKIEQFIFNFPSPATTSASTQKSDYRTQVLNAIKKSSYVNAPRVKAHPGQIFFIRNAEIEILCTLELFYHEVNFTNFRYNNTSVVFAVRAEGKQILILGDCYPEESAALTTHYTGETLKSDAVQIAHHGIEGTGSEIYSLVKPQYAFWPAGSYFYAGYYSTLINAQTNPGRDVDKDMRKTTFNEWFTNPENIDASKIYLAGAGIQVASISQNEISVATYESTQSYCGE